jgi:hypothetical protein
MLAHQFWRLMHLIETDARVRSEISVEHVRRLEQREDKSFRQAVATVDDLSGKTLDKDSPERARLRRARLRLHLPPRPPGRPPKG